MSDAQVLAKIRLPEMGLAMKFCVQAISPMTPKKACVAEMKMSVVKPMRQVLPVIEKALYAETCVRRPEQVVIRDHVMTPVARPGRPSAI